MITGTTATSSTGAATTITEHEAQQVDRANAIGLQPMRSRSRGWREVADTALAFVKRFV
ncbi:MAG: hypothetical protein ABI682_00910 [Acidobacteriota bacterium]